MNELAGAVKTASDFGVLGVLTVAMILLYRLVDKYGGAMMDSQRAQAAAAAQQASAIQQLVETVKEGQNNSQEVLMAVRTLSDRIDRQTKYLEGVDRFMREGR